MSISPQDVQAKLDQVVVNLQKTTSSYVQMVKKYGSDSSKWPATSNWHLALSGIAATRTEVGGLTTQVLSADFTYKES